MSRENKEMERENGESGDLKPRPGRCKLSASLDERAGASLSENGGADRLQELLRFWSEDGRRGCVPCWGHVG
jgi:hypothetical protein